MNPGFLFWSLSKKSLLARHFSDKFIKPHWQIGILKNPLKDIVNGVELECEWLNNPYRSDWFADPFVLDVTEGRIELLVEDFRYKDGKGRISKLTVDRRTMTITNRKVLLEGGHYSFPAILRKDGRIYLYPEQSRQGRLDLFEYCPETETCKPVETLSEEPLTDAIIYKGVIFSTQQPEPNGSVLELIPIPSSDFLPPLTPPSRRRGNVGGRSSSVRFDECIARNAGDFFEVDGVTYRPAQECNRWYGNAVSIQRFEEGKFTEVRRIPGIHTLNSYQGVTVVDRKIFPFKWLYWLLCQSDK